MSVVGNNLTSLQRLAGYPRFSDDGNLSLEERYACLYSSVSTLLPARGAVHPDFTTYLLKRRSWERDGDSAIVTLIYGIDGVGSIPVPGGTAVQESRAVIDVEQDPDGNPVDAPGIIYISTTIETAFSFSASEITSGVGSIGAPPGLTGATADEWKKTGRTVEKASDGTRVSDEYKWKDGGWT